MVSTGKGAVPRDAAEAGWTGADTWPCVECSGELGLTAGEWGPKVG